MKNRQKWTVFIMVSLLLMAISGCGGAAPSSDDSDNAEKEVHTMKLAYSYPETAQHGINMNYFKQVVEEETDGRIEVVIFPNAQLGAEDKQIGILQSGAVEAIYSINGSMETICPEEAIYTLPFFWVTEPGKSEEFKIAAAWDSPIESWLREKQEEEGIYRLGNITTQIGQFVAANNVHEITRPEDMKGMKIRHSGGMVATMTIEKLDANPITVAGSEVPVALSQGIMDGLQTSAKHYHDNLWHTKYLNATHMKCYSIPLILNLAWYEALPQDLQDILQTVVMPKVQEWAYHETSMGDIRSLEEMKEEPYNVEVVINTPEEVEEYWANYNNLREEGLKLYLEKTGDNGLYLVNEVIKIKKELGHVIPEIPQVK